MYLCDLALCASVAQQEAQLICNQCVAGSIPVGSSMGIQLSWWQRLTVNQQVVGSSPSIPVIVTIFRYIFDD